MIMRPGQQLLLPAKPLFIWGSLLSALLLNMLFNMGWWGRSAWTPDMLALVLVIEIMVLRRSRRSASDRARAMRADARQP